MQITYSHATGRRIESTYQILRPLLSPLNSKTNVSSPTGSLASLSPLYSRTASPFCKVFVVKTPLPANTELLSIQNVHEDIISHGEI